MFRFAALVVAVLLLCALACFAQTEGNPNYPYRNLVLEGGGVRGIAYGGALGELEKNGILQNIRRVGGTSAGAIQAALLSVGYTPEEIARITAETPVKQFNDGRMMFFGGFRRLVKQYGWYRGEIFSDWIGKLIKEKTGNADLTLGELHELAASPPYRDLYTVGTNLTTQRAEVFSYETHPHMRVRDAVRISMSIPLYFRAVLLNEEGKVVKKPAKDEKVNVLVDGGILANYPIDLFDHTRYFTVVPDFMEHGPAFNAETLGIRLERDEQIEYDREQKGLAPYPIHDFQDYMSAFYTIVKENLNRHKLSPQDWGRTISVSTAGFSPRIKRMSAADKQKLWNSGKAGAEYFFQEKERQLQHIK